MPGGGAREIHEFIRKLDGVRTIPSLLGKILSILRDERASPRDLYQMIAHDQALAERLIRVANSAMFGRCGSIREIGHAILFLGYERIRSIALGMGLLDAFPAERSEEARALWVHGYEVGFIAAAVAEAVSIATPSESFLCGLIHDIGRVIFYEKDPHRFRLVGTGDDVFERERELFGCTHPEAGGWYAERAGIPSDIVLSIRHHHDPSASPGNRLGVGVVSLAEAMARRFRPRPEDDGLWTAEHDALVGSLAVGPDRLQRIIGRVAGLDHDIRTFFG